MYFEMLLCDGSSQLSHQCFPVAFPRLAGGSEENGRSGDSDLGLGGFLPRVPGAGGRATWQKIAAEVKSWELALC